MSNVCYIILLTISDNVARFRDGLQTNRNVRCLVISGNDAVDLFD